MYVLDDNPEEEKEEERSTSPESSEVKDDMERLRRFLAQKLRLVDYSENDQNDQSQQKILCELSLDGIVEYIKKTPNCKIITMAGAGISTCKYASKICLIKINYLIVTIIYNQQNS